MLVVDADHGAAGTLGREQGRLGLEVLLHGVVEVEVVTAEVEEHRHVEDHAVDPSQHQRVAGDLHGADLHPALDHQREQAVQVRRLGRGESRLHVLAGDAGPDRADHRGDVAGGGQTALEEAGRGRLPLGARHPDHRQPPGGVAVDLRAHRPQDAPRVVDDQGGRALGQPVGTGRVGQHGDRPRGQGLDREVRPVRPRPRQPRVEVAGPDPSGAQGDTGDLDRLRLPAAPGGSGAGARGELAQRRTRRVGGAGIRVAAHGRTTLGTGGAGHHSTAHHSTGRSEGLVLVGGTA